MFEMRTTLVSGGGISTLQPEADPTYRLGRLGLDEELLLLQRLERDSDHSEPMWWSREWRESWRRNSASSAVANSSSQPFVRK